MWIRNSTKFFFILSSVLPWLSDPADNPSEEWDGKFGRKEHFEQLSNVAVNQVYHILSQSFSNKIIDNLKKSLTIIAKIKKVFFMLFITISANCLLL